jgi:hypothetical protein
MAAPKPASLQALGKPTGHNALKFTANGHNVSAFKAGTSAAHLQVQVRGLQQLTIVLPNGGSDAGILDVTSDALS